MIKTEILSNVHSYDLILFRAFAIRSYPRKKMSFYTFLVDSPSKYWYFFFFCVQSSAIGPLELGTGIVLQYLNIYRV